LLYLLKKTVNSGTLIELNISIKLPKTSSILRTKISGISNFFFLDFT
jgi:hypothetical protein